MRRKLLLLLSIAALTVTVSCNKEDAEHTHKGESNNEFQEAGDQVEQDIMDLTNAEGIQAIQDFMNAGGSGGVMTNGRLAASRDESKEVIKRKVNQQVDKIKRLFVPDQGKLSRTKADDDVYFDYNSATGIYEYKPSSDSVEKVGSSQNIVVHYPYKDASTNNATFTMYSYSETDSIPTGISADIAVDGNTVVTISYSATLNSNYDPDQGSVLPLQLKSAKYSFYVKPFTMSFGFQGSSTSLSYNTELSRSGRTIFGSGFTVNFDNNVDPVQMDFGNGEQEIYPPSSLEAYVQYAYLRFNAEFDLNDLRDDQDNNQDLNFQDYLTANVTNENTGQQIGKVTKWDFSNDEVIVTKTDGSKENIYSIFEPAVQEAEDLTN